MSHRPSDEADGGSCCFIQPFILNAPVGANGCDVNEEEKQCHAVIFAAI